MFVLSRVDYVWWKRARRPLCAIALASLLLVLVPGIGTMVNGARRWIIVAGFSYSPSELAKLAAVCLVAGLIVRQPRDARDAEGVPAARGRRHPAGRRPDHARARPRHDARPQSSPSSACWSPAAPASATSARWRWSASPGSSLMIAVEPYRMARLDRLPHPWKDPQGSGYQTAQSLISIASGHLVGVGLGNSVQKFGFLPEQTTDMITGIIGEELGLIGLLVLIALYVALAWVVLPHRAPDQGACSAAAGGRHRLRSSAARRHQHRRRPGHAPADRRAAASGVGGRHQPRRGARQRGHRANIATNRRSHIVASPEREKRARGGGGDRRAHDAGARRR